MDGRFPSQWEQKLALGRRMCILAFEGRWRALASCSGVFLHTLATGTWRHQADARGAEAADTAASDEMRAASVSN